MPFGTLTTSSPPSQPGPSLWEEAEEAADEAGDDIAELGNTVWGGAAAGAGWFFGPGAPNAGDPNGRPGDDIAPLPPPPIYGPPAPASQPSSPTNQQQPQPAPSQPQPQSPPAATEPSPSPSGQQSGAPCPQSKGPYSNLKDPPSVGPGKDFTAAQKANIIAQNMQNNGGVVKSDQSGTTLTQPAKSQPGVTPDPNEWQIDHIIPVDQGGTNSYSNAQVLSRAENRAKWNK
jgi:hypothetical protein